MKVLVDANILMMGIDLSEYRGKIAIPLPCLKELEMLSEFCGKRGRAARVALMLVENLGIEVVEAEGDCDPSLADIAIKMKWAVATNDRKLIKALSDNRIEVLRPVHGRLERGD